MTGLRVVQWATGNIGSRSLRHVIQHPGLTLAGVYVTSTVKAGRDAGELCGLPPTGVTATRDISEAVLYLASDASRYVTGLQLKVDAGALLPVTTSGAPG